MFVKKRNPCAFLQWRRDLSCCFVLLLVDAAEIEDYLAVVPRQGLELVVCGEHHNYVGLVEGFLVGGELELLVLGDIGFHDEDVGVVAHLQYHAYDVLGGRLAKVVDVWLEC